MTADGVLPVLVFDSSVLSAFATARRLPTLRDVVSGHRLVTTQAVVDELSAAGGATPDLTWLDVVHVDTLVELRALVEYTRFLGSGEHDMGEATTLAWAEVHGGTVIIDDEAAKKVGRRRRVECHGTLWLIVRAFTLGRIDAREAERLVDVLAETNARFPCDGSRLFVWAQEKGLLDVAVGRH